MAPEQYLESTVPDDIDQWECAFQHPDLHASANWADLDEPPFNTLQDLDVQSEFPNHSDQIDAPQSYGRNPFEKPTLLPKATQDPLAASFWATPQPYQVLEMQELNLVQQPQLNDQSYRQPYEESNPPYCYNNPNIHASIDTSTVGYDNYRSI